MGIMLQKPGFSLFFNVGRVESSMLLCLWIHVLLRMSLNATLIFHINICSSCNLKNNDAVPLPK